MTDSRVWREWHHPIIQKQETVSAVGTDCQTPQYNSFPQQRKYIYEYIAQLLDMAADKPNSTM
jgi:hypothetical protein